MSNIPDPLLPRGSGLFARTRWSLVHRAAAGDRSAPGALGEWLDIYWYPLYAWARRRGLSAEDAGDGVQSFLEKICAGNLLAHADATRGKLRSWLLKSFSNHLSSEDAKTRRQKRGGGAAHLHIDWTGVESTYLAEPALAVSPEALYARTWALSVMEEALDRVAAHYAETGRAALFEKLLPALEAPLPGETSSQAAAQLGMTGGAFRQATVRLRQRYRRALLDVAAVRLGITCEAQLEEELRALLA